VRGGEGGEAVVLEGEEYGAGRRGRIHTRDLNVVYLRGWGKRVL